MDFKSKDNRVLIGVLSFFLIWFFASLNENGLAWGKEYPDGSNISIQRGQPTKKVTMEEALQFVEQDWCVRNGYMLQNAKTSGKYHVFLTVPYGGSMSHSTGCILKIPTTGDLRIIDKSCGKLEDVAYTFEVY